MEAIAGQLVSGISRGMLLSLVASGLTLIFGMLKVINFAHGAIYMAGAYVMIIVAAAIGGTWGFVAAIVVVPIVIALVGVALEITVYRRVYAQEHMNQIVLTYALALIVAQFFLIGFGGSPRTLSSPDFLRGAWTVAGVFVPRYSVLVTGGGLAIALATWLAMNRTRVGWMVMAAVDDPLTAQTVGINVNRLVTLVFAFGVWLAAVAGALATVATAAAPGMDVSMLIQAFAVIVIGGVGSMAGALLAALMVGITQSLGVLWFPKLAELAVFALMALVLVVRPQGLFGRAELTLK